MLNKISNKGDKALNKKNAEVQNEHPCVRKPIN